MWLKADKKIVSRHLVCLSSPKQVSRWCIICYHMTGANSMLLLDWKLQKKLVSEPWVKVFVFNKDGWMDLDLKFLKLTGWVSVNFTDLCFKKVNKNTKWNPCNTWRKQCESKQWKTGAVVDFHVVNLQRHFIFLACCYKERNVILKCAGVSLCQEGKLGSLVTRGNNAGIGRSPWPGRNNKSTLEMD